jgi:hypothetical protein
MTRGKHQRGEHSAVNITGKDMVEANGTGVGEGEGQREKCSRMSR